MTEKSHSMDEATLALAIVAMFVATLTLMLLLTESGLAAAVIAVTLPWFFGRPAIAISLFITGCLTVLGDFAVGGLGQVVAELWRAYAPPLLAGDIRLLLFNWWSEGLQPRTWILTAPGGLTFGAAAFLLIESRRQSELLAVMQGRSLLTPRPAPFAYYCRWRVGRKSAAQSSGTVLGTEKITGATVVLANSHLNHHCLMTGASGSGKTNSLGNIIESWIDQGRPITVIDGKGNSQWGHEIISYAMARGRPTYFFDGTQEYQESATYNPFASGDHTSCADRFISIREWTESFYKTEAQGYAQMVFRVTQKAGVEVDLISIAEHLTTSSLFALVRRRQKNIPDAQALLAEIAEQSSAEENIEALRAELRNLARSALRPLFDTRAARDLGRPIINLQRARGERAVVYFGLPALKYPELSALLGKLIVNDCKAAAFSRRDPWLLGFDEFGVFAGPQVLVLINQGREFGVHSVCATISLHDLARSISGGGEAFVQQVIAAVSGFMVHRMNSPTEAETIALVAGTKPNIVHTAQLMGGLATGMSSARPTKEFVVHPDAIKAAKVGEAVWINKSTGETILMQSRRTKIGRSG
jgi:conjugal transfer pilus assembly protein TraD